MQCAKCFRVCRLSSTGKTWVCTICKHREKANGGQAVSDFNNKLVIDLFKQRDDLKRENEALKQRIKHLIELGLETSEYGLETHRTMWEKEAEK